METSLEILNLGEGSLGVVWVRQFLGKFQSGEQAEPCPGSVLRPAALGQGSACSPDAKFPGNCLTHITPRLPPPQIGKFQGSLHLVHQKKVFIVLVTNLVVVKDLEVRVPPKFIIFRRASFWIGPKHHKQGPEVKLAAGGGQFDRL